MQWMPQWKMLWNLRSQCRKSLKSTNQLNHRWTRNKWAPSRNCWTIRKSWNAYKHPASNLLNQAKKLRRRQRDWRRSSLPKAYY
ncbi:unnamed protein product [Blepharisma stoltei]|uniref:Uncharacterized protein n=1 Tax=Blepharisma stoltei TaxID=1481888 RepID=A0AAU9JCJ4_9CILI|nr:unnamed protein product [Blepharisma stoltei]